MTARESIICAIDGGRATIHLARVAADVARVLGAPLDLVHVVGAMPDRSDATGAGALWPADSRLAIPAGEGPEADAARTLDRVAEAISEPEARRHVVPFGDPGRRVARLAEDWGSPLIVVGTRGNAPVTDALGRVSSRLAADAPCPVLAIAQGLEAHVFPLTWPARTLVCGVDGSPPGWNTARCAADLASRLGGSLSLIHVGPGIAADTVRDSVEQLRATAESRPARRAIAARRTVRATLRRARGRAGARCGDCDGAAHRGRLARTGPAAVAAPGRDLAAAAPARSPAHHGRPGDLGSGRRGRASVLGRRRVIVARVATPRRQAAMSPRRIA